LGTAAGHPRPGSAGGPEWRRCQPSGGILGRDGPAIPAAAQKAKSHGRCWPSNCFRGRGCAWAGLGRMAGWVRGVSPFGREELLGPYRPVDVTL